MTALYTHLHLCETGSSIRRGRHGYLRAHHGGHGDALIMSQRLQYEKTVMTKYLQTSSFT
jgi:hypothetical protein